MKLYHGTTSNIEKFSLMIADDNRVDTSNSTYQTGIYFSDDEEVARGFSKIGKTIEVECKFDETVTIKCNKQRFGHMNMDTIVNYGYEDITLTEFIGDNLDDVDFYIKHGISLNEVVRIIRTDLWESYDAVIMEEVIDNGWWSDSREKISTVVVVLNDNVINIK